MKALTTQHSNLKFRNSSLSAILVLILVTGVALSCRFAESLTGDPKAGTVSSLWPDVPPFAGAEKADLEIPLGARLAIRAFMQGKINFIAFTTDQSATDVQAFYSNERMKAAGWTPSEKGCVGDTEDKNNHGAVCLYTRKDGSKEGIKGVNKEEGQTIVKEEGLAIVVAFDEKTKRTQIFYVRIDLTQPSPSPSKK